MRILLFSAAGLLSLMAVAYALLLSPCVQTSLVKYVTRKIEEDTGVKVRIGRVDFRPMSALVLNDILLRDFQNDTLAYCRDLEVKADSFDWVRRTFHIREVFLDGAVFNLWVQDGSNITNIEMLLDSLSRDGSADTAGEKPVKKKRLAGLHKISLRNSRFTYREEVFEPTDYGVNWTDVDCREVNADIFEPDFTGSPMKMEVAGLGFVEKSGLRVKSMSGKVRAGDSRLLITGCRFELERSQVDLRKLEFNWKPGHHDWKYFTSRMQQYYELGPSSVSFIDLAYFNGILRGITNTVKCRGIVSNTVNRLEGRDLYFELGEKSVLQGSFKSAGLPDVWNTVFNIELRKAHLGPEDLAGVYLPWFDMNIPVPGPLYRLPCVDFEQIRFDGLLEDFAVRAESVTPELEGRLDFVYGPCEKAVPDCAAMRGDFHFDRIDFRKFTGLSFLGNGVVSGAYDGVWEHQGPSVHLGARLHRLKVNRGSVRDADLEMNWKNGRMELDASVDDAALAGYVALSSVTDGLADSIRADGSFHFRDLDALGFGLGDGAENARAVFGFVHAGRGDAGTDHLTLTDLEYAGAGGVFTIGKLCVEDRYSRERSMTALRSDVLDFSMEGNYKKIRWLSFLKALTWKYLPACSGKKEGLSGTDGGDLMAADFRCRAEVKDANRVLKVLYPELSVASGSEIDVSFRHGGERLGLSIFSDTIVYQGMTLSKPEMRLWGGPDRLKAVGTADGIGYGDAYRLYNVRNELDVSENHLDERLNWANWEAETYSGELSASVVFTPSRMGEHETEIQIHPGVVITGDSVWHVDSSVISVRRKDIRIQDFAIRKGRECLSAKGEIAEDSRKKLQVKVENLDLENMARVVLKRPSGIFGMLDGSLTLQDYYGDFLLQSDFSVGNWGIGRDTFGNLHLHSRWDAENGRLLLGARNRVEGKEPLSVFGYYSPSADSLDMAIRLEKVGLGRIGVYASDVVSDVAGRLSGNIRLCGGLEKPDISGVVCLDSVGMKINLLNTDFFIHDSIHIGQSRLCFDRFLLRDRNGNRAVVNGEYRIWENRYHLDAGFDRFLVLNTTSADNESFYGRMYLSGLAGLDNSGGSVKVNVNARTEDNSRLYIPLKAGTTGHSNNFLHFVSSGQEDAEKAQFPASFPAEINLDANLEVNDNLEVQVVFDPTVGDILRTVGNGDVKIAFDKDGKLNLFGEYRISKGDYLFTLSNLVNKKFVLTPGGTVNWSGSPYDAVLDINAVYRLKTGINELLPAERIESGGTGEKASETGHKVPVECILNLSDHLTNPAVKFDIDFPTLETQLKNYIRSLFSSQDEVNKQMFSLLVLNHFYRTDNAGNYDLQAQTAGVTTLTEMMSNQLSRWFSQFSNNVDIGIAYRVGDRAMNPDEIEVALSTQLLNDRVTISANGNMDVGGTRNAAADSRKANIAGDFDVEVKLNRQGTLKMKAYSHTDEKLLYNNTETIQGVGISYQESFDTLRELLRKYFGFFSRKK